jgi:phosphatidylglycerophosphate synthase
MSSGPLLWIDTGRVSRAVGLFGIPPLERLRRSMRDSVDGRRVVISGPAVNAIWKGARIENDHAPLGTRLRRALAEGPLVAVDGGNVIDPRLINFLMKSEKPCVAARGEATSRAVALYLDDSVVEAIPLNAQDLVSVADALSAAGLIAPVDENAFPQFIHKLRRSLPYWIHRVEDTATRDRLERQMFWDNYKGSTDLLTRYVYPPLVWQATRLCARWRVHPNVLTVISIVCAFACVPYFARGEWLIGFVLAYVMSVLDSVDGKVARLTLTDSKIGNTLDHGLDIVHPPFWYFSWALGLGASAHEPLYQAGVWLIVFYVADRLVLGQAKRRLGYTLHAASRLDERVRSVIARRNIMMTIMVIALLLGVGEAGFYLITAWQALTFLWHGWRTLWFGYLAPGRAPSHGRKGA